jgi:hypothetical protein
MMRLLRQQGSQAPRPEMGESNMARLIPPGIEPHGGRGKAARLIVLACGILAAAPVESLAQPVDNVRTFHVPARSFNIPFTRADNDSRIDVLLNVSRDGQNYRYHSTARFNDRVFPFTAPADGWYYFIVQTKDPSGALSPADLRGAPPSIKVYVDTQSPVIEELAAEPDRDGSPPGIRWKINEPEENIKEIRMVYGPVGSDQSQWVPLLVPLQKDGKYTWKPHWGGELEVRMWVQDKAGQWSQMRSVRLKVADNVSGMKPPEPTGPSKVMHVKNKTFRLQYQLDDDTVGPSHVASVDIWKLRQGRGWVKCRESVKPPAPAMVTVDESGRWGFRLIPRSGVGLAERDPQPGDTPDVWVEVDDKPPQVKIKNVTVTQEADGGYLTVYWIADDTFLRAMPITIQMKAPDADKWTTIATELPNTGSWRHPTKELNLGDRYEFSLMVSAIDEASNSGSDTWRETVKIDLKIPRIKSIDVNPGGAAAGGDGHEASGSSGTMPYGGQTGSLPPQPMYPPLGGQSTSLPSASQNNGTGGGFSKPMRP